MEMHIFERRTGSRARVDLPASTYAAGHWHECRAVDLSPNGMVLERPPSLLGEAWDATTSSLELRLAGARPIRVRTRTVWTRGARCGLELVVISDVDRLTIAELLDGLSRRGHRLH